MKGDYFRYLSEVAIGDAKAAVVHDSQKAYQVLKGFWTFKIFVVRLSWNPLFLGCFWDQQVQDAAHTPHQVTLNRMLCLSRE